MSTSKSTSKSSPAGQERKQAAEQPYVMSPSGMGHKITVDGKSLPVTLHSFLGVIQDLASDGLKLMGCVGSLLTERGLPELASHLHKCLIDITQTPEIEELRSAMETLHKVPLDEKGLLPLLSVLVQCQVDVLEKTAHRLKQLLYLKVKGEELEKYLPQSEPGPDKGLVSRLVSALEARQEPILQDRGETEGSWEEGRGASAAATPGGGSQAEGDEGEKVNLVSDQEMNDVIDLLSGRKPPPPVPLPTLPPSSSSHLPPNPSQLVFTTPPLHKLPPPPVPQKPPPHLLHPHNLVLENTHCPLRPQGSLDSALSRTVKTNTWPLRPGSKQQPQATAPANTMPAAYQQQHQAPNFPYDGFSSDLEFSQFVNSVRQRAGVRMSSKVRDKENPWGVVGDPSWSPLMYDSREGRQWSTAEDSSNCSDESSSNGDWMVGPELVSSRLNTSTVPVLQRVEATGQNSLPQDMQGMVLTEEGTKTWPPKQQWAPGAVPTVPPNNQGQVPPPTTIHHHPPLGITYSEPQMGSHKLHNHWDMAGY